MTNNPTIDGVSRELLADLVKLASRSVRSAWGGGVCEEARSLLDAPAVERQESGYVLAKQTAVAVPGQERKELGYTLFDGIGIFRSREEVHAAIAELGLPIGWVSMTVDQLLPGYLMTNDEVSEVAALQSTIAQIEDKLNKAIDLDFQRRETIARLEARVRELESGVGKPFMYGIMRPDGTPHYGELCVSGEASDLEGEAESWTEDGDGQYRVVPLFTAPTAPVAQQLDTPTAYLRNEGVPNNLVVCGFDHPDAFKVFRVPPAPVAALWEIRIPDRAKEPSSWFCSRIRICRNRSIGLKLHSLLGNATCAALDRQRFAHDQRSNRSWLLHLAVAGVVQSICRCFRQRCFGSSQHFANGNFSSYGRRLLDGAANTRSEHLSCPVAPFNNNEVNTEKIAVRVNYRNFAAKPILLIADEPIPLRVF